MESNEKKNLNAPELSEDDLDQVAGGLGITMEDPAVKTARVMWGSMSMGLANSEMDIVGVEQIAGGLKLGVEVEAYTVLTDGVQKPGKGQGKDLGIFKGKGPF